jgi:predicted outer membrane repeat protein
VADDGVCSIREALANATDGKQTHADCAGGPSSSTVILPSDCTFHFTELDNSTGGDAAKECQWTGGSCSDTVACPPDTCIGIATWSDTVTIAFTTISGNTGAHNGGGIAVNDGALTLASSVLEKNLASGGDAPDIVVGTEFTSGGYNHVESSSGGFVAGVGDTTGTSPDLANPADNGGPTRTMMPNAASPVLDAVPTGTNGCGTIYKTDQRGKPRPSGGSANCDKGAVEL